MFFYKQTMGKDMTEKCRSFLLIFSVSLASLCLALCENLWVRKCHILLITKTKEPADMAHILLRYCF